MTQIYGQIKGYERRGIVSLAAVDVSLSARYRLFAKNPCCVRCGLEGLYYARERSIKWNRERTKWHPTSKGFHFNLYGLNSNGDEIMLTKDHIIPRSKGGPDNLSNYQTMCSPCNMKKGDKYEIAGR